MFKRRFWLNRLRQAWERRSVVWLMGVRRVGKTVLARSIPEAEYLDCELPATRARLADPEAFLASTRERTLVLDEIHRLENPAEFLKIAADYYPEIRILATGSSMLGASSRFRDTLTGRKAEVWLTPMTLDDLTDFGDPGLDRRLLRGGLPSFFLAPELPGPDFQEWLDAFWAKDVLELFRLERRHAFQRLVELLMAQSGGIFEATRFARACEVSRTTIGAYTAVLEATFVVHLVRPYVGGGKAEIVAAPKAYGFDTGFVCHHRGWTTLRPEDRGLLLEHLALNELHAHLGRGPVHYWRSKHGNEVDFVIVHPGRSVSAVECKWSAAEFEPAHLRAFRSAYPEGPTYVVCADVRAPYIRRFGNLSVEFVSLRDLITRVSLPPVPPA